MVTTGGGVGLVNGSFWRKKKFPSWDPGEGTKLENERLLNHKVIGWKMYRWFSGSMLIFQGNVMIVMLQSSSQLSE